MKPPLLNRDLLLDAVLGRFCTTAPAELVVSGVRLLVLNSHWSGHSAGRLGAGQLQWLSERLQQIAGDPMPLVVALHHPPMAIGHPVMDTMNLIDHGALRRLLLPLEALRAVVFGHIHQHWEGCWPDRVDVPLLGAPSTLKSFQNVQPCPLNRAEDPGGRLQRRLISISIALDALGGLIRPLIAFITRRWRA
mgnify:CR=1 FL=1